MNDAAHTAVARVSRLPAPRPPKTCAAPPPPNAAPMPPPLPCCRSTTNIRTAQKKMCRQSSRTVNMRGSRRAGSGVLSGLGEGFGRTGDSTERADVQARAADEGAVDVGAAEEREGVVGLDGAAVEDADLLGEVVGLQFELTAQGEVDFFGLGRAGVLAGADGPDGLVGDG